jgi:DNA-binding transcriptional LysR family regulator
VRGRLRINADPFFASSVLAPRLPEFLGAHPELELDIVVRDGARVHRIRRDDRARSRGLSAGVAVFLPGSGRARQIALNTKLSPLPERSDNLVVLLREERGRAITVGDDVPRHGSRARWQRRRELHLLDSSRGR